MTHRKLLFPEDVRELLTLRFRNQRRNWLGHQGQWPLVLKLGSPSERDLSEDASGIRAWVNAWSSWHDIGCLSWEKRQWPRMGRQNIPTGFTLASPEEVARLVGQQREWVRAHQRYERLVTEWPTLSCNSVLLRHYDVLAEYDEVDFERLCSLLIWLERNPESMFYVRQLPIAGLDTKWVEKRTGLVTELVCAIRCRPSVQDFFVACGLQRQPHRIRLRILCPDLRKGVGYLEDVETPLTDIAKFPLAPARAIIVENLETGLALPDLPGMVAFMKLGNSVSLLKAIPWLQGIDSVYWGDIDTHGYAILNNARRVLPELKSVLMDKETLFAYQDLWVEERVQSEYSELLLLHDHERTVWEALRSNIWGTNVRLEQERIPWKWALDAVKGCFEALDLSNGFKPEDQLP